MNRSWITLIAGAALLAGCAVSGGYGGAPAIPVGSELVLHERLPLGPGNARVYIQGGEVVTQDVDRFHVACYIRIQRRGEEPLTDAIEPGRFLAIENSRSWARSRPGDDGVGLIDRRPMRLDFFTEVEIRSDLQPQVDELHCRYNGWRTRDAPGLEQIQRALGDLATVQLPADAR